MFKVSIYTAYAELNTIKSIPAWIITVRLIII